ncbi:MAG: hypothetical protein H6984_02800 [Pseudomonadales bacterium]|nr:hypothetical protein [Halioglobus sp.]MCP5121368.1 hypothetical protein [Pseudomonadales bacterium]MCP5193292.1 hypothetical protein [Pseudomonadales bacterium]
MVSAFERIVIAVPGLEEAGEHYRRLLGVEVAMPGATEPASRWFVLPNVTIELVQSTSELSLIRGLVFRVDGAAGGATAIANSLGLDIQLSDGSTTTVLDDARKRLAADCLRVDHLVLRTTSAAACIDLFGDQLGIRLALDQTVPEWGGRMLFFRTGKLTLEIIEPVRDKPDADFFWGIAYQCRDLHQTARLLAGRGVSLSAIRAGRKPGSLVATVKSHCLGIPTLLLQQPD